MSLQIVDVDPDDTALVERVVGLLSLTGAEDCPWEVTTTVAHYAGWLRHGSYLDPLPHLVAVEDGMVVAEGYLHLPRWDNLDSAEIGVTVHPQHRRRGIGTALFSVALQRAHQEGRHRIDSYGWKGSAAEPFAASFGLRPKYVEVRRRQDLTLVPRSLFEEVYAEASTASAAYYLERISGPTPDALLEEVAAVTGAINDAPLDEMEAEDEQYPVERVRLYEQAAVARGERIHRMLVRHRDTGELAGHTVVMVERDRPGVGQQHHTSVVRAHRGHRLGLLLKSAMCLWLADDEPALRTIDTWNADSNGHMVAVNERLGYHVLARGQGFQND